MEDHDMPRSLHPRAALAAALISASAALLAASPASAATTYTCEASAIRATILTAPAIEPVVANRGQQCKDASGQPLNNILARPNLPVSLVAAASETKLEVPGDRVDQQTASAVGGLADVRVKALPDLPIPLPPLTIPQQQPIKLDLPLGSITVDINAALNALLPGNKLPDADLVRVQTAIAYANASCVGGKPQLTGSSQVAGLSVLGQELPVNQAVKQALTLDTGSINPSNIDLSKVLVIQATPGITLSLAPVADALRNALKQIPPIALPPNIGQVKITPGSQTRTADTLTQQGLHVQVSLLGQNVADLLVGEAKVGSAGVDCSVAPTAPANELVLQCTKRRLVLTDVLRRGKRVRIVGVADRKLAGKRVSIHFTATGRRVASAVVSKSGNFRTTAALPSKRLRRTNKARYQAVLGKEKSLRLKLVRRMVVRGVRSKSGKVTISGRVSRPLGRPARTIRVVRRVSCKRGIVVKRIKPRRDGTFRVTVSAPPRTQAAVYRLGTQVRKNTRNPKLFPTFTLPRAVEVR